MLTEYGILLITSIAFEALVAKRPDIENIVHRLFITVLLFIVIMNRYRLFLPFSHTISIRSFSTREYKND